MTNNNSLFTKILEKIQNNSDDHILWSQIIKEIGGRGFGVMLILFSALPALPLPAPPGITTLLALPIFFIFIQILIGKKQVVMPNYIMNKKIKKTLICSLLKKINSVINKFSSFYKPRLLYMSSPIMLKIISILGIIFSISIATPIPFSNTIPSIGIFLIGIGMIEKDGLIIKIGIIIGSAGVALTCTIYYYGIEFILNHWNDFIDTIKKYYNQLTA